MDSQTWEQRVREGTRETRVIVSQGRETEASRRGGGAFPCLSPWLRMPGASGCSLHTARHGATEGGRGDTGQRSASFSTRPGLAGAVGTAAALTRSQERRPSPGLSLSHGSSLPEPWPGLWAAAGPLTWHR